MMPSCSRGTCRRFTAAIWPRVPESTAFAWTKRAPSLRPTPSKALRTRRAGIASSASRLPSAGVASIPAPSPFQCLLARAAQGRGIGVQMLTFSVRWFSGTGKGGQHRNKHQNCVELVHLPTGARRTGQSSRSRESNLLEAKTALLADLDAARNGASASAENSIRKRQIGSGMRGDKRRTYRFQDDAVVDHETGKKARASAFMRGDIEALWA